MIVGILWGTKLNVPIVTIAILYAMMKYPIQKQVRSRDGFI